MNVSIARADLIALCTFVASHSSPELSPKRFKNAFERRNFVNGFLYKFSLTWAEEQTDETLFEFYQSFSETIKLLPTTT